MPLRPSALASSPAHARTRISALVLLACAVLAAGPALAGPFTINGNSTTAQTLGPGAGQTGVVGATATLTVSGSTVAVTVSGNTATLTNLGSINQTGTGRVVRDNTGVAGLMITNGSVTNSTALMQSANADVIQMNVAGASVQLDNYGTLNSLNSGKGGAQAVDFAAITTGSNVVNNYATGILQARDADAVRPGANGVVNNYGKIIATNTTDTGDDGVDLQNNSGASINNFAGGSIAAARHGITGGQLNSASTFSATIVNAGSIQGNDGSGINLDGFNAKQTATIVNSGSIVGNGVTGDGDGVDVDGVVNITNSGLIRSVNAFSPPAAGLAFSEGISVGGGSITNSGTIEGLVAAGNTNALGRGITLAGNDITSGPLAGTREALYASATVTNQAGGVIRGQTDSAIVVVGPASGFTVTINNNAGASIIGGGASFAAIRTGADNDVVRNAGTIDGSSSGRAIDLGAGNNSLFITGGAASIIGSINGGMGGSNKMEISPGAGNSFAYAGSITNFDSVEAKGGGHVTLSGSSSYIGKTIISDGTLLTLDGANRLSNSSALVLNGGTLELANAGGVNGQTFASLSLLNSSFIDLDGSSITFMGLGTLAGGKTLTVLDYLFGASPDYALRFFGDFTGNADFLALVKDTTINGLGAKFYFDGTYTDVRVVPEPGTLLMALQGLGLMGFIAVRRRRRRG